MGRLQCKLQRQILTISCVISPQKKITIDNFEEFFKKDKELPVNFHDGTGFNFEMKGKMMSDTTINIYKDGIYHWGFFKIYPKDGITMIFKTKYQTAQIIIEEGELFENKELGDFRVSYINNNTILRLSSLNTPDLLMETSDSKTLLQIKKTVAWKWMDAAGFQYDVKGWMKDQNSISFLRGDKRIALDRKIKASLTKYNN